ncbi:MAG: DUF983 domain-containing protein [Nitratireductor sp.]|nr:DUF983 domain-containing protein [Nitratireductor sp.]MCB1456456.1 DUF983 domain-containing protein [Nitratireductor sp.]MCB1459825.1 DUF983 domain-containing protein [Nitratireductor sp.]
MKPQSNNDKALYPPVSPVQAGLKGSCPRCGVGKLYSGVLTPARQCMNCGLDYSFIDAGDGPAVFVIMILGFLILGAALAFEAAFHPPLWLHIIVWVPLIIGMSIWGLRFGKAMMTAMQYQTNARQGELAHRDETE